MKALPLLRGDKGDTGPQGPVGAQGIQGAQGVDGAQGIKGDTGDTGTQGPQGVQGTQGVAGANGTNGADGDSAYQVWINEGNSGTEQDFLDSLQGADGAQGPQGVVGNDGNDGAEGIQGVQGEKGDTGDAGPQGIQGAQGPSGNDGADGQYAATKEYASFYLSTGGVTGVSNTATTLVINNTSVNSDGAIFSLASNEVTVNKTGTFEISVNVYFNTGGSSRSEFSKWIEVDSGGGYTEVSGSRFVTYQRGYDSGGSASVVLMLAVTSGDKFRLRVQRTDGGASTGYQDANGTRFNIKEL